MDRLVVRCSPKATSGPAAPRAIEPAAPGEVRVRRALLSVSEKHGIVEFAQGLRELGVEIVSTGGTAGALARRGHRGEDDRGLHRLSRDHGRAREDAAPAAVRGPVGKARRRRASRCGGRAGDRAGGPGVREPVPVRADRRAGRCLRAGDHREHRHRRADDDPCGRQEPGFAAVVVDPGDYEELLGRAARVRRPAVARRRARAWRPRRSPAPPATTPRSPAWFSARTYEGFPPT